VIFILRRKVNGGTTTKLHGGTLPNRTAATTLKVAAKNLVESLFFLIIWAKPDPFTTLFTDPIIKARSLNLIMHLYSDAIVIIRKSNQQIQANPSPLVLTL